MCAWSRLRCGRMRRWSRFSPAGRAAVDRYTTEAAPARQLRPRSRAERPRPSSPDMDIPGQWWTLFHSKALDDLISAGPHGQPRHGGRPGGAAGRAGERLCPAGGLLPQRGCQLQPHPPEDAVRSTSPSHRTATSTASTPPRSPSATPSTPSAATRRQLESLKAQADFQRFQLEAAYLTLTSNVVAAAIGEAAFAGRSPPVRRIIEIQSRSLELLRRQYSAWSDSRGGRGGPGSGPRPDADDAAAPGKTIGPATATCSRASPAVSRARPSRRSSIFPRSICPRSCP